ncbi:hypothetical protein QWT69_01545 [Sporosarcina oncorhynchi]|uniref:Uncharacterized protein n=1 Tax=Sporosarcina oncorhynchi TaxID=3056444 RepID=A0ABZ0L8R5_9BACL|nr:hypothetical protein [Sporosarcina sp. T2O-4]WOV87829.1 hypothetical protein QWT69_01545 [Sporosarcina sp. T2O-4]
MNGEMKCGNVRVGGKVGKGGGNHLRVGGKVSQVGGKSVKVGGKVVRGGGKQSSSAISVLSC